MEASLRLYHCIHCHCQVTICSMCDHGNIYCSGDCANNARMESLRAANSRYQQTPKGRMKHAHRQSRYRKRQYEKAVVKIAETKKVTDHGSSEKLNNGHSPEPNNIKTDQEEGIICQFCAIRRSNFLRNGFLRSSLLAQSASVANWPQGP